MPFRDNGLLFLTTSLVIQSYDLEHDSRCERHTVFALKCFRRHTVCCSKFARNVKYCSNVAQSAKKCLRVLKIQNSAPKSKKCSKDIVLSYWTLLTKPTKAHFSLTTNKKNIILMIVRVRVLFSFYRYFSFSSIF